ncbi:hypothetical protein [Micropruina sp.]|uniref:hypothetical protein n=1 Tax=Micropruina sp. TaxID=2737536 RepID=UPI0039E32A4E
MPVGRRWLAVAACLLLAGCGTAEDAAISTVQDARSAVVVAQQAVRLRLDTRATTPYTQVVLDDSLDAVGDAEQELRDAAEPDITRTSRARVVLNDANTVLDELADAGADQLSKADLDRLTDLVTRLDATLAELRR